MNLKKINLSIVCIIYFSLNSILCSQSTSDFELHNRYRNNRENFRKYFKSIGKENGQGLPFKNNPDNMSK